MLTPNDDLPSAPPHTKEEEEEDEEKCRIIVLGSTRARVARAVGLLLLKDGNDDENDDTDDEQRQKPSTACRHKSVAIEYLPCVPTFDSYQDDASGQSVRYLARVDYFGRDGTLKSPESLLPFFDEDRSQQAGGGALFPSGIAGAVVAGVCGIDEGDDDLGDAAKIGAFLDSLSAASKKEGEKTTIPVEGVGPNPGFGSLREELAAFRALTAEERAEATRLRTMGPGKVAKFAEDFARRLVDDALEARTKKEEEEATSTGPAIIEAAVGEEPLAPLPRQPDPTMTRYSCRKCRTVLFDRADLQDPPHAPSQHTFSYRNHGGVGGGGGGDHPCRSHFLQSGMAWMGSIDAKSEDSGKMGCPRCDAKMGTYHWSGAQCSCGTWVVPAIQVPCGRVDEIPPGGGSGGGFPAGTVVCPVVIHQQQQQQQQQQPPAPEA